MILIMGGGVIRARLHTFHVRTIPTLAAQANHRRARDSVSGEENWRLRYNIAPTQPVPIIRQHPKEPRRELSLVRWGLIPSWAKDAAGAAAMTNARS